MPGAEAPKIAVDTNILVYAHRESGESIVSLLELCTKSKAVGSMVHDARVAALCDDHGIDWLLTADRDFGRFPGVKCKNPLLG